MTKRILICIGTAVLLLAVALASPLTTAASSAPVPATPIPQGPLYCLVPQCQKFIRYHPVDYSKPVNHVAAPQHPYMAPNGKSNMHCDPYMTDTYEVSGPLGLNSKVSSTYYGLAECVTLTFDSQGRIVTVLGGLGAPVLLLLDPQNLAELARYELPPRPWYWIFDDLSPLEDPSGGAYFYLDNEDNVVVTTHDYRILVIKVPADPSTGFQIVSQYDLSAHVLPQQWPNRDKVGPAIMDWNGRYFWYTTRYGLVGLVDRSTGVINSIVLPGEQIQNSPAVAADGFYVITDHAMYRFVANESTGAPEMLWRIEYDRGTRQKPGMLTQGSGTTPTLMGDLVAIADNADPKMNVIFLSRGTGQVVCSIPVFKDNESCTENSLIGVQHTDGTYSVIVENNYGVQSMLTTTFGNTTVGGVTRIHVVPNGSGGYSCYEEWTSNEISCTPVPKMSLNNGLIYLYTKPKTTLIDMWYFTAVDFATGQTVYRVLTGTGLNYNNNWAPITLGPNGGTAYIGSLAGLMMIRDN